MKWEYKMTEFDLIIFFFLNPYFSSRTVPVESVKIKVFAEYY